MCTEYTARLQVWYMGPGFCFLVKLTCVRFSDQGRVQKKDEKEDSEDHEAKYLRMKQTAEEK